MGRRQGMAARNKDAIEALLPGAGMPDWRALAGLGEHEARVALVEVGSGQALREQLQTMAQFHPKGADWMWFVPREDDLDHLAELAIELATKPRCGLVLRAHPMPTGVGAISRLQGEVTWVRLYAPDLPLLLVADWGFGDSLPLRTAAGMPWSRVIYAPELALQDPAVLGRLSRLAGRYAVAGVAGADIRLCNASPGVQARGWPGDGTAAANAWHPKPGRHPAESVRPAGSPESPHLLTRLTGGL